MSITSSTKIPPIPPLGDRHFQFKILGRPIYLETDNISEIFSSSYNQNSIITGTSSIWRIPRYLRHIRLKYFAETFWNNGRSMSRLEITDKNSILNILNSKYKDDFTLKCDVYLGRTKIAQTKNPYLVTNPSTCVPIRTGTQKLIRPCKEYDYSLKNTVLGNGNSSMPIFMPGFGPAYSFVMEKPQIESPLIILTSGQQISGVPSTFSLNVSSSTKINHLNYKGEPTKFEWRGIPPPNTRVIPNISDGSYSLDLSGWTVGCAKPTLSYYYGGQLSYQYEISNQVGTTRGEVKISGNFESGFSQLLKNTGKCSPPIDLYNLDITRNTPLVGVYSGYMPIDATGFLLEFSIINYSYSTQIPGNNIVIRDIDLEIKAPGYMISKLRNIDKDDLGESYINLCPGPEVSIDPITKQPITANFPLPESIPIKREHFKDWNNTIPTTGQDLVGPLKFKFYSSNLLLPDCRFAGTYSDIIQITTIQLENQSELTSNNFNIYIPWGEQIKTNWSTYSGVINTGISNDFEKFRKFNFKLYGYQTGFNFNPVSITGHGIRFLIPYDRPEVIRDFSQRPILFPDSLGTLPFSGSLTPSYTIAGFYSESLIGPCRD